VVLLSVGQVPQQWATAWIDDLFHPLAVFGVFLPFLILKFPTASARTPPKITFFILWASGVHRKFTREIWYFFWYFHAHLSTALKNRPDENL